MTLGQTSCHEFHRASGERWIGPAVACIEQGAEPTDLASQREDLVRDALRNFRDYETLDAPLRRELGIRLAGIVAYYVQRTGLCELGSHSVEIETVRTVLAMRLAACCCLVIGHKDTACQPPATGISGEAHRSPAFHIVLDLGLDDVRALLLA